MPAPGVARRTRVYALLPSLKLTGTLAYTRGRNETDAAPLAQMPPLEARLGLEFSRADGPRVRCCAAVAAQDRYVVNQGNIVGQDLGPTAGFTVLSLNGGWRPRTGVLLTAGVDNLFDRAYAEHLSRGGAWCRATCRRPRSTNRGALLAEAQPCVLTRFQNTSHAEAMTKPQKGTTHARP